MSPQAHVDSRHDDMVEDVCRPIALNQLDAMVRLRHTLDRRGQPDSL